MQPLDFDSAPSIDTGRPWYRELNRYHWFVFIVASLGWLFDTMDQQLFTVARKPAMQELLKPSPNEPADPGNVNLYSGRVTSIFLLGWATGGLLFGVLGDRYGRARIMLWTILIYSIFTGLSAFSWDFTSFAVFRFITGMGVGGEFAVGVTLVAEVMPQRARASALGLLQALSALGNITAALIGMLMGTLQQAGAVTNSWRIMFAIGTLPALLAILIRSRLKEPDHWQEMASNKDVKRRMGSYADLFGDPRWRKRAIVGLLLASAGVIGLWGIGFFSVDLTSTVLRKHFIADYRKRGDDGLDRQFVRLAIEKPDQLPADLNFTKDDLVSPQGSKTAQVLFGAFLDLRKAASTITEDTVIALLQPDAKSAEELRAYLAGPAEGDVKQHVARIADRTKRVNGELLFWPSVGLLMQQIGAFFGIYAFAIVTQRLGRRLTFAIFFVLAAISTALVFWNLQTFSDIFWMLPIMGFCQLALFGGYAIYFPELFPTRLRSTGVSFCYNVGRFVAASGPYFLGYLSKEVFGAHPEPMRYAGVAMCGVFFIGLLALPFAPETKDEPLPE